jgi:predicted component of type VI protein secretion system
MFNFDNTMPGAWPGLRDIPPSLSPISMNKTLYVAKFTDELPMIPEAKADMESVEDVMEHYKPEVTVLLEDAEGQQMAETFKFTRLGDFTPEGIVDQSPYLQDLTNRMNDLQRINHQLRSNRMLQYAIQNPQGRATLLAMVQQMIDEIDQAD